MSVSPREMFYFMNSSRHTLGRFYFNFIKALLSFHWWSSPVMNLLKIVHSKIQGAYSLQEVSVEPETQREKFPQTNVDLIPSSMQLPSTTHALCGVMIVGDAQSSCESYKIGIITTIKVQGTWNRE